MPNYGTYNPMTVQIVMEVPKDLFGNVELAMRMPAAMKAAAKEGLRFWESEAGQRLNTSREAYLKGLKYKQLTVDSFELSLEGKLAHRVETGGSAFDMAEGFLASSKMKPGPVKMPRAVAASLKKTPGIWAARKYMIIPINHSRQASVTAPRFRTFTEVQYIMHPPSTLTGKNIAWGHPGNQGVNILDDVIKELEDTIVQKHVLKMIDEVFK